MVQQGYKRGTDRVEEGYSRGTGRAQQGTGGEQEKEEEEEEEEEDTVPLLYRKGTERVQQGYRKGTERVQEGYSRGTGGGGGGGGGGYTTPTVLFLTPTVPFLYPFLYPSSTPTVRFILLQILRGNATDAREKATLYFHFNVDIRSIS